MADDFNMSLDSTSIAQALWQGLPLELTGGVAFVITLAKAVGIAVLIYIAFLIVKSVVQTRQALRIKSMQETLEQINKKLDILVGKKSGKEDKDKK
jgi:heme exporter protein D